MPTDHIARLLRRLAHGDTLGDKQLAELTRDGYITQLDDGEYQLTGNALNLLDPATRKDH